MSFLNYEGLRAFINKIKQLFVPRIEALEQTAKDYLTFDQLGDSYTPNVVRAIDLNDPKYTKVGLHIVPPTTTMKANYPLGVGPRAQLFITVSYTNTVGEFVQYVRDSFGSSASRKFYIANSQYPENIVFESWGNVK